MVKKVTISQIENWYRFWYHKIEDRCSEMEYPFGFDPPLLCSLKTLLRQPKIAVFTLNPAGNKDHPENRGFDRFHGQNAYLDLKWGSYAAGEAPFQKQMASLFTHLQQRIDPVRSVAEFAREKVVTAQFIPYRSQTESSLHCKQESIDFSQQIWRSLFQLWKPSLVIAVGKTPARQMAKIFAQCREESPVGAGWGRVKIQRWVDDQGTRIIGLPHLSRFALFGRCESAAAISEIFDWACWRLDSH